MSQINSTLPSVLCGLSPLILVAIWRRKEVLLSVLISSEGKFKA